MFAALRQWKFPREFRIEPPAWSDAELDLLRESVGRVEEGPAPQPEPDLSVLADVGTGLWRLRQKMIRPGSDEPLPEMRQAYRHLESTWDALSAAGVEIQDHTGARYDPGMALEVLAFQPTPGLGREKVIETIKPTVYYRSRSLQMATVIVGTPEQPGGPERRHDGACDHA